MPRVTGMPEGQQDSDQKRGAPHGSPRFFGWQYSLGHRLGMPQ
jgi:hypothetical protein